MFEDQQRFMELLSEKRNFHEFPVDLNSKQGQKICKAIAYDIIGEVSEVISELKNSKQHRQTDVGDLFDKQHYLEEIVDATHFLFELVIMSGFSVEEYYDAYMKKGNINTNRINSGY